MTDLRDISFEDLEGELERRRIEREGVLAACTGMSAAWCPVHGTCICPDRENGMLNDDGCPLHNRDSDHAEHPDAE